MTLMVKLDLLATDATPRIVRWMPIQDVSFMLSKKGDKIGMTIGNGETIYVSEMDEQEFEQTVLYAAREDCILQFTATSVEDPKSAAMASLGDLLNALAGVKPDTPVN